MKGKGVKYREIKEKPCADYRGFRLSRINEPRFAHLKLLLGWVIYFVLFVLTERLIPAEKCHAVHCAPDDLIPFCEVFVIPYVLWYFLIIASLVYFAIYNVNGFSELQRRIIIIQMLAVAVYIIFPTRQDLRPEVFERNNIFTRTIGIIYSVDTNTGVCPSLHVACSIAIGQAWLREKGVSRGFKAAMTVFCLSICLSTVLIKQHSLLDGLAAIPVCIIAEGWALRQKGITQKRPL